MIAVDHGMTMKDARKAAFAERLRLALKENELTRAEFARHFGAAGQQIVNGWLQRGRIGQPSVPTVRRLLPKTDMEWLNEGSLNTELPEKFSPALPGESGGSSQFVRLDRDILHEALTLLLYDEHELVGGGPYSPRAKTDRLAELYEWVERDGGRLSAVSNAEFMQQVNERKLRRGQHE